MRETGTSQKGLARAVPVWYTGFWLLYQAAHVFRAWAAHPRWPGIASEVPFKRESGLAFSLLQGSEIV